MPRAGFPTPSIILHPGARRNPYGSRYYKSYYSE